MPRRITLRRAVPDSCGCYCVAETQEGGGIPRLALSSIRIEARCAILSAPTVHFCRSSRKRDCWPHEVLTIWIATSNLGSTDPRLTFFVLNLGSLREGERKPRAAVPRSAGPGDVNHELHEDPIGFEGRPCVVVRSSPKRSRWRSLPAIHSPGTPGPRFGSCQEWLHRSQSCSTSGCGCRFSCRNSWRCPLV